MTAAIRNFFQMAEAVLDILRHTVFDPVRARTELFLEDLDNWLNRHNLTLPQLTGYIFATMGAAIVLAMVFFIVGAGIGSWFDTETGYAVARGIILFGAIIGFLGFLPLLIIFSVAHSLFNLLVEGGEAAMKILDSEEHNQIPERIRQQLETMRNQRNLTNLLRALYAGYAAAVIAMLWQPNFHGLYLMAVGVFAVSGIVCLRLINRVRGHGIVKLMLAGTYGFMGGAIVYVILSHIAKPMFFAGWPDMISNQTANRFVIIGTALAAAITFLAQLRMRLGGEEDEIRKGDVPVNSYKVKVSGIDATTGKPTAYQLDVPANNWKKYGVVAAIIAALSILGLVIFKTTPSAASGGFLNNVSSSEIAGIIMLTALAGIFVLGFIFSSPRDKSASGHSGH